MATTNLNYPRFREGEDLNCYLEQLEECFKLNKTLEADKVSVLLTSIDVNVYKTLRDLLVPRRPSDLKYKDLVEVLTNHLYPIKNKHYERYLFHKIVQKENEPVGKFVLRLKSQADKCKFTDINENLCDQFVSGCFDEATLKRLLSEPFLTFDSAINIANSVEAAKSQEETRFLPNWISPRISSIEMDEASKNLLVVSTHRRLYRYNRLPFGISPASAIFQRCMDSLFHDVPNTVIYLDDIFIGSKDEQEHYRILKMIFDKLKELNFTLNKEKCLFLKKDICFLGHIINEDGFRPDSKKLEALERCKKPFDKTSLKSFLGMLSFYSKYIPNMSTLAGPLYQLLKKDNRWKWSSQCEKAFLNLKLTLLNSQALIHYSMKLPLTLTCDASAYGISGVLCHIVEGEEKPITFVSRTLSSAEVKYSQTEKEALAIVFATSKLRQYLFGRKFVLKSDHKALTTVFGNKRLLPPLIANRLHRWALELSNFDFDIRYTNKDTMLCADAFSRLPLEEINSREDNIDLVTHDISFLNVTPLDHIIIEEEINKYPVLNKLKEYLLEDPQAVIPRTCQDQMLKLLHQSHIGINRMKSLARSSVWWPKMDSQIEEFVKECSPCMHHQTAPPAENTPWPRTNQPWQRVHVDHFYFRGDCYLLVVDANSNWIEVFQLEVLLRKKILSFYGSVSPDKPPVERLLSYVPRTFVNCLNSEFIQKTFGRNECGRRHFQVGDKVLFTRVIQNRRKWFKAQVIQRLGYNVYLVKNLKGTFKVHVNQMRTGSDTKYAEDSDWTLDNAGAGPHRLEQDPQISTSPPPRRSTRPRCPPCRNQPLINVQPLQIVPLPIKPWIKLGIEIVGPIGHHYVLTVIDYYSSYPEAMIKEDISSNAIIKILIEIFARHGYPREVVIENGLQFVNASMEKTNQDISDLIPEESQENHSSDSTKIEHPNSSDVQRTDDNSSNQDKDTSLNRPSSSRTGSTFNPVVSDRFDAETLHQLPPEVSPPLPTTKEPVITRNLFNICLALNTLEFHGSFFIQTRGSPMGSPLSTIAAEIVMSNLDRWILSHNHLGIELWSQDVDDIFCLHRDTDHLPILNALNSYNPDLRFTHNPSRFNCIPFLDVLIVNTEHTFHTTVYRKPKSAPSYLHFKSHAPISNKITTVKTISKRIYSHCSLDCFKKNEKPVDGASWSFHTVRTGWISLLIRNTLLYVLDHWQCYKESNPTSPYRVEAPMMLRLQLEIDHFFFRSIRCLFSTSNTLPWQFMADLPYRAVSLQMLWQILWMFYRQDYSVGNDPDTYEEMDFENKLADFNNYDPTRMSQSGMFHLLAFCTHFVDLLTHGLEHFSQNMAQSTFG
ncbi:K02A2.6-like [Cordylochernes scorpioides]|uniref:RNA-directed DNA polymerase n=1 Tax=Cordylochernes scorpioides TaxID=51811 RepID=A0ABY6LC77_9ARAC|nr:K02A2.6-like [Cordylochernes scorpioides]